MEYWICSTFHPKPARRISGNNPPIGNRQQRKLKEIEAGGLRVLRALRKGAG